MVAAARNKRGRAKPLLPGDRVKFRFGLSEVVGEITDELGPVGKGGQTVYHIEFSMGGDEPLATRLTPDQFERVR